MRKKSLICAYLLDGKGTKLTWKQVKDWQPEQGKLWIHLNLTSKQSVDWLYKNSGLDKASVKSLTALETRPRVINRKEQALIFLRALNTLPGQDPEDMLSLRIYVDKQRIITIQKRDVLAAHDIANQLDDELGPTDPVSLLQALIDLVINRMVNLLEDIDDRIDSFEDELINPQESTRVELADLRRQIVMLRRYLGPQRDALHKLSLLITPLINEVAKYQLQENADRVIRYLEDLDSARERTSILQEELSTRQSELLNRRMYILSAVTVLFLPLSFITGLLGINVGGIPGATSGQGFLWVCIILSILTIITLIWFRRYKWF